MIDRRPRSRRLRLALSVTAPFAIAFAIALSTHCGTDQRGGFADSCEDWFGNQCGKACTDDTQCGDGLYCADDKKCNAQCAPNATCAEGVACSPKGRCGGGEAGGGGGGGFGNADDSGSSSNLDGGGGGDSCADINVTLEKVLPTVLLLIDQSKSMTDFEFPEGSGVTRWEALRSALIAPDGGIVKTLQNDVSFGVTLYSWQQGQGTCPRLTKVNWKLGNYASIFDVYADAGTINNTPTAESIMGVVGFNSAGVIRDGGFAAASTPGPKILVLATDGDPDTCADPDSNGQQGPRQATLWATQRTYDAGIPTYVVSVGTDIDLAHQQEVANAGQGVRPDAGAVATVYRPTNRQQLVDALEKVILGVRSCTFTLNGQVVAGTENKGVVTLNGGVLGYNDPHGWKLNSPTELEIVGNSCKTLQTTPNAQISVRFPCGTVVPANPK